MTAPDPTLLTRLGLAATCDIEEGDDDDRARARHPESHPAARLRTHPRGAAPACPCPPGQPARV